MSQPGLSGRHRQRRDDARPAAPVQRQRPLLAIAVVLLVGVPIGWLLVHQPSGGPDAAIQYVTRDDDRYATPSTEPTEDTEPTVPPGSPTPTPTEPTGTPTPSSPPTPGATPSASPTGRPTGGPTARPSGGPSNSRLSVGPTTEGPSPTNPSTDGPGTENTPPPPDGPPPPVDNGGMSGQELELFSMIDNARAQQGCAPLKRNTSLTRGARSEAGGRAASNDLSGRGSKKIAAGGNSWNAGDAYNSMMDQSSGTLLNCGLQGLGIGRSSVEYEECETRVLVCLKYRTVERVSWVARFR